jgi:CHAT domain-containing protein/Flp pilus assembly protein TadD
MVKAEIGIEDKPPAVHLSQVGVEDLLQQAIDKLLKGKYQAAIADLTQVLQLKPESRRLMAIAYANRGIAYYYLGDSQSAIRDLNQALQIEPDLPDTVYAIRGKIRFDLGDYGGALVDYTQSLRLNPVKAEIYNSRCLVQINLGNYQEALVDCNRALRLEPEKGSIYLNRGLIRHALGDFQGAIEDYTQSINLDPADAQAYSNRCFTHAQMNHDQEAIADCNQALKIRADFDEAYTNRCLARIQQGNYQAALEDCNQSIRLSPNLAETYYHRGTVRYHLGDWQGAGADYQQAANLYQKQKQTNNEYYRAALENVNRLNQGTSISQPQLSRLIQPLSLEPSSKQKVADTFLQQGIQQYGEGKLETAFQSWQKADSLYQEIQDVWGKTVVVNYLQLLSKECVEQASQQFYQENKYESALNSWQLCLKIARTLQSPYAEITIINEIGFAYLLFGNAEKGIEYLEQGLPLAKKLEDRSFEGRILGDLSTAYLGQENYKKAIDYAQQSLLIAQHFKDNQGEWLSLNKLGLIYFLLADNVKAIDYFEQSLLVAQKTQDLYGIASALEGLREVYSEINNYEKAREYGQQTLQVARQIKESVALSFATGGLGVVLFKSGNPSEAEKLLYEAINISELRRKGFSSDAYKVSFFDTQISLFYEFLQEVLIAQNKTDAALEVAERGRSRAFVELLAARISSHANKQYSILTPEIQEIREIAKRQNATLVEYSIIHGDKIKNQENKKESELFIWVVKPTGEIEFRRVDLKPILWQQNISLEQLLTSSRASFGVRERGSSLEVVPLNSSEAENQLKQLHKILIAPIADLLPSDPNAHVIFMPQGELFLVPFPALQDANGKYLIEKHTILTAPAIQVLDLTQKQRVKVQQANPKGLVVVGNPTMPKVTIKIGEPPEQLNPLPAAENEAITIAKLLNTKALTGNQATKKAILSQLPQARIIHLATHGLLDDFKGLGVPGAIALAPSGNDNGLLTADEILNLKLNAELVVLSACDTGRGRITGDGVIGLSRSLITAGVPSIIVSLWSVPDAPTASLMTEFYRNWQEKKLDKAQALRQAMLTTMKNHPNPKDWAAFTLIGEAE